MPEKDLKAGAILRNSVNKEFYDFLRTTPEGWVVLQAKARDEQRFLELKFLTSKGSDYQLVTVAPTAECSL